MSDILPTIFPLTLLQGGDRPDNVFSHLGGHGSLILAFLTYRDANALRATCKEACTAVAEHKWMDSETRIKGSLKLWRICFRNARAANISYRRDLKDIDFVHLKGIHTLNMSCCNTISKAAFTHLKGIHTLDMSDCNQITGILFIHFRGIHTLNISGCWRITDQAFRYLEGIHTLNMSDCSRITDAAFVYLKGIHTLVMQSCYQDSITNAAFTHLKGMCTLDISESGRASLLRSHGIYTQKTSITDAAFIHLNGCHIIR